jgi:phosphoribosyl 1,2-cyclic phosphodiesterase
MATKIKKTRRSTGKPIPWKECRVCGPGTIYRSELRTQMRYGGQFHCTVDPTHEFDNVAIPAKK